MKAEKPLDIIWVGDDAVEDSMRALVEALECDGVEILCARRLDERAYVDLAVAGLPALRSFVALLNAATGKLVKVGLDIDATLNWSDEVVTGCNFEELPDWIMLSLTLDARDADCPTVLQLDRAAEIFKQATAALRSGGGDALVARGL